MLPYLSLCDFSVMDSEWLLPIFIKLKNFLKRTEIQIIKKGGSTEDMSYYTGVRKEARVNTTAWGSNLRFGTGALTLRKIIENSSHINPIFRFM